MELKKMKNSRVQKEIAHSSRSLSKLGRQAEAAKRYRNTLAEIKKKNENRDRLSHKITEIRKDILELREIGDKIHSLEKDLKKRFPQFYDEKSEGLPDMDRIQELFNSVRDWNEKIDQYHQKRKRVTGRTLKGVIALLIFVFFSAVFLAVQFRTSGPAPVRPLLFVTALSALISAAGIGFYFRVKKKSPVEMLDTKKGKEKELLELLYKNRFPVEDFKTGELYDFLFQYFEDFITFRDIRNELSDLRKKISSTVAFTEKEKKLDSLNARLEETEAAINSLTSELDGSLYPVPEPDGIDEAISALNETIREIEAGTAHEKTVMKKLEEQLGEDAGSEMSSLEIESGISEIEAEMDKLKNEISALKFLEEIFREASGPLLEKRIAEFTALIFDVVKRHAEERAEDLSRVAENISFGEVKPLAECDAEDKKILSLAFRSALSEYFSGLELPPVLIIDPLHVTAAENLDESGKILLELFRGRQVILLSTGI